MGFSGIGTVKAQKNYKNYTYFIYTIAKKVQWPAEKSSGDFVIGVLGDTDLMPFLTDMSQSKRIGGRKIKIVRFSSHSEIKDCQMVFIPEHQSNNLYKFLNRVTSASILVVTESPGMGKRGSGINFISSGSGKLEFELNIAALKAANLKVSSDIVRFAKVI